MSPKHSSKLLYNNLYKNHISKRDCFFFKYGRNRCASNLEQYLRRLANMKGNTTRSPELLHCMLCVFAFHYKSKV